VSGKWQGYLTRVEWRSEALAGVGHAQLKDFIRERMHSKDFRAKVSIVQAKTGIVQDRSGCGPNWGSPEEKWTGGKGRFKALLSDIRKDLLYGFRILKKNPGFTAVALITLALGIGINTALFSLFEAWHRLPDRLEEPDTLAFLWYRSPASSQLPSDQRLPGLPRSGRIVCADGVFVSRDRMILGPRRTGTRQRCPGICHIMADAGFDARRGDSRAMRRTAGKSEWSS